MNYLYYVLTPPYSIQDAAIIISLILSLFVFMRIAFLIGTFFGDISVRNVERIIAKNNSKENDV